MADLVGQSLGQYKLVRLLGEGGMAAVYQAHQESMNREVAVKVIKHGLIDMEQFAERFKLEARMVASLSHAHILKVFDYGQQDDIVYLVMELLSGGSLEQLIRKGPLSLEQTGRILDHVTSALDYAHSKGIIHRDLKPDNVLMDESGNAFITDFGLAKLLNASQKLTQSGAALGTPTYMAPEQWRGQPADARTDVYALGVMLFEMLTGNLPFNAESALSLMYQHMHELPPLLTSKNPDIPLPLEDVLERAMAKNPDERFQSAGQLAQEFHAALGETAGSKSGMRGASAVSQSSPASQPRASQPRVSQANASQPSVSQTKVATPAAPAASGVPLWAVGAIVAVVVMIMVVVFAVMRNAQRPSVTAVPTIASLPTGDMETPVAQTLAARGTALANTIATYTAAHTEASTGTPTASATATSAATATPKATTIPSQTATLIPVNVQPTQPTKPVPNNIGLPPQGNGGPTDCNVAGNPPEMTSKELTGHTGAVTSIAFSQDPKYLASGSYDKTARLWSVNSGQTVQTFAGHTGAVTSVAIASNNKFLLTGSADGSAIMWSIQTGAKIYTFNDFSGAVTSVAFSKDGKYALAGSIDQTAKMWDTQSGTLVQTFADVHTGAIIDVAFSNTGQSVATVSDDMTAVLWKTDTGKALITLKGHTGAIRRVMFTPDGKSVVTGSDDGTAKIWSLSTGNLTTTVNRGEPVVGTFFNPEMTEVFVAGSTGGICTYNVRNGQYLHPVLTTNATLTDMVVATLPGSPLVATAAMDGTITLWTLPKPQGRP